MNVLSLFSGVGGFDLGLENAGMKTIYQCEWDKHATTILERHWPQVPRWGDISTLTAKEILRHGTPPDVVAWGSPCQDLSVAGKRAGLEGERSGLFHEGIRIINELRKETNNEYPRISIWENVAGALSSNRGADFGVILDEMAKAGAMVIEWALLDAQHFGIPQRRRRIFCIAVFNSATASICPSPLLPVGESLPRDTAKGKPKRKSAATTLTEGFGAGGGIVNAICGETYHHGGITNQDLGSGHMVVEDVEYSYAESSFAQFKEGEVAALKASGGVLGGGSETLIVGALTVSDLTRQVTNEIVSKNLLQVVEPYVESRRAQTATDDETWVPGEVNPTLNSFDVGDTRSTTVVVGSLQARDYKGVNHEGARDGKLIIEQPMLIDGTRVDDVRVYEPPVQTLGARMGTGGNNVPVIGIQGNVIGRQPENGPIGKGHTEEGDPMFTLTGTDIHAVAYPIDTRNALRDPEKYDAQNRQGLGIGNDGDPMATLTSTHVNAVAFQYSGDRNNRSVSVSEELAYTLAANAQSKVQAVAYDEYNDSINETHHALRAGTKQSTGVLEPTMAVRRLTPLECERLMGWPDDHTRYKADGTEQADTHRYKQCGNGVASPVAEWIGKQLMKLDEAPQ
jgi:DNA (cytosine-5)-methyltransferase 1